ncbi:MAG: YfhO family protein [Chloroflexi bacterium]|nr:YfhO family protein [Chloroflexota bacterium]
MSTLFHIERLIYRLWGLRWSRILLVLFIFAIIGVGLSAIQTLPTAEYQMQTTRADFSIDHKGSGFQFHELGMILFPRILGDWAPLYIGIISLALVGLALWRGGEGFWVGTAMVSLLLAFGQRTVVYSIFYVFVPGFTFFRFQERAVVMLTAAMAVLAARGAQLLLDAAWDVRSKRYVIVGWAGLVVVCGIFAGVFFVARLDRPGDSIENASAQSAMLAFGLSLASLLILWRMLQGDLRWGWAIAALLIFDLFSINMNNPFNFDPIPAHERIGEADYVSIIRDNVWNGQTVDGMRGIGNSYGTLYRVPDTFGNGPLRPKALEFYLYQLAPERRWELLGVQVVTSGEDDLPVPNQWIGAGQDGVGRFNIHRLTNPRAFALLYYDSERVSSPEAAWDKVADPAFPLRETVIVEDDLPDDLSGDGTGQINLLTFEPEYIELQTETDSPAVASFALPYVTGWQATIDGEEVEVLRTFGGLTGIYLEPGQHRIVLRYIPDTFIVGAGITGVTLLGVIGVFIVMGYQSRRRRDQQPA